MDDKYFDPVCPECGKINPVGAVECIACGAKLGDPSETALVEPSDTSGVVSDVLSEPVGGLVMGYGIGVGVIVIIVIVILVIFT
jgi:hypothetical protein